MISRTALQDQEENESSLNTWNDETAVKNLVQSRKCTENIFVLVILPSKVHCDYKYDFVKKKNWKKDGLFSFSHTVEIMHVQ